MSRNSTEDSQFFEPPDEKSKDPEPDDGSIRLVNKAVIAEGESSVALGEASNTVVNTGTVQGDIFNITIAETSTRSPLTADSIGSALSLVKLNQSLSSELSKRMALELENARESFREGKTSESFQAVRAIAQSSNWEALDESLRALVLRSLANMVLSLRGKDGIAEAEAHLEKATSLDPACDVHTVRVRIKSLRDGYSAALLELQGLATLDAFNMRVGLLIETDEVNDALKALESPPPHVLLDAESFRLKALALLIACDLEGAGSAIEKALRLAPKRQNVRIAAALVDYYSSVSSLALQKEAITYPYPLNPALVKRDDQSQKRLKRAARTFGEIAAQFEPASNAAQEIEAWQIACVANTSDGEDEVTNLCRSALTKCPTNFRVLAWVLYRRYEIDLDSSETALRQRLDAYADDDSHRIHYVLALLGIHLKRQPADLILKHLESERHVFENTGRLDLWSYWRCQALVAKGHLETALEEVDQIKDAALRDMLKVLALCEIGNRDRDWARLFNYLEAEWNSTKNPQFLIHLCEIKAQMGDWDYVADRAEEYCDRVGTASSAYLAISAARKAHRNQLCLCLLEKYKNLFPGSVLPEDLMRLQAYCKLETQDVRGALADVERLVAENDSVENILSLIDVLRTRGDLSGVETAVRRLRNRDLTARQCLQLAEIVRIEDPTLAREFWRRAKDEAQKDKSLAPFAVGLAFKLGLDREIGSLWRPVDEIARGEDETIQLLDMEQLLSRMREQQAGLEKIHELYATAEAPLALVAQRVNRPMFDILNGLADENGATSSSEWHSRPRLWIRHGARLLPPLENFRRSAEWRLHVDSTSLILAHHLGLLDKIEQAFRPLRISGKLPAALLAQRSELMDIQQTQMENYRTIIRLVDDGKLHSFKNASPEADLETLQELLTKLTANQDWQAKPEDVTREPATADRLSIQLGPNRIMMLACALTRDGFAVGLLPLRAYGNTQLPILDLPEPLANRVVNCRTVLESLRAADRISDRTFTEALTNLGEEAKPNLSPTSPLVNSELLLMQGAAHVLAGTGVLEQVCDGFAVFVSEECVKEARDTLQEYDRRGVVAATLENLVQRINAGIEDGTYEFISISDERLKQTADLNESENLDFAATSDLFRYQPGEWDIFWIDDRAINKYAFLDRAPIVAIGEILAALRQRESIDKHEYYAAILKMRVQNFRYLPIDDEEISYYLTKATVKDGAASETEGLRVLRRYVASCLLDTNALQPETTPEGKPKQFGESAFISNCLMSLTRAIAACWEDETATLETARARADWVLDNLYVGLFGVLHLQGRTLPGTLPFRLLSRDITGLLMNALNIGDPLHPEQRSEKRAAYFQWLASRVTDPRFRSEPKMLIGTAREVERMFSLFAIKGQATEDGAIIEKILLQKLFLDLPDELRDAIDLDAETREWLGVITVSAAQIGGYAFDGKEFVSAVKSALAGDPATIRTQNGEKELQFRIIEKTPSDGDTVTSTLVGAFDSSNQQFAVLGDPMLNLLSSDLRVREKTLRDFRGWFDGSSEEFETKLKRIATTVDPHERLDEAKKFQTDSSEAFYLYIEQRLRQRALVSDDVVPRSVRILLRRFKLPSSFEGDFLNAWDETANTLLNDLGLQQAIERCSSLPVRMPNALIEALASAATEERSALTERLLGRSASPITRLHLGNLLLRTQSEPGVTEAQKILSALYDESGAADFAAFHAVLIFVHSEIERSSDINEVSPQIRLALTWAHATTIHNIFHAVGFSAPQIIEIFQRHTQQRAAETILREPHTWDDCLHPRRFERTVFLTHGVAKMLTGIEASRLREVAIIPLIEEKIIRDVNGTKIPDIPLLQDSDLQRDGLGSIFGGDHSEALSILDDDNVELLSSAKLKEVVEQSLDQILVDQNDSAWASIMFVLGDLAIYPDLRGKMRSAISNIRIDDAFMASPGVAHAALMTAANQVRHWGDEKLRLQLRQKTLAAIRWEAERDSASTDQSLATDASTNQRGIVNLIDAALKCSIVHGDLITTGQNLADTLEAIFHIWPEFGKRFGSTICAFVWELPVEVTKSWWLLLLKLRATLNQAI